MVILGLETATRQGSVALFDDGQVDAASGDDARTHGQRLPRELFDCLDRNGRKLDDVDLFAVIAGPGSFTGLRVGMATIQGLALTRNKSVVQVPTLEAIAFAWRHQAPGDSRTIVPCVDGQRGEVFFAAYAPDVELPVIGPEVGSPEAAADAVASRTSGPTVIAGDGAVRYRDAFVRRLTNAEIAALPGTLAEAAVRIAAAHPDRGGPPHALRPIYVRKPDAELARARAQRSRPKPQAPAPSLPPGFTVGEAAGPAEIAAVESLQRRSFTNAWGIEAIRWELENTDVARLFVLRDPAGAVVAYCACWLIFDELHINSVAVDDAMRRQGLADTLLRAVIRDAYSAGARSATLEVRRSNEPALALYEKLGFRVEAVRREYYQHPREDALVLWHRRLEDVG